MIIRETIVAGNTIMRALRPTTTGRGRKGEKRAPRSKPSSEAVKAVNKRNAERKLTALLNHNFRGGDFHLTLTYSGDEPSKEEAKKNLNGFIRKIRRWAQENMVDWKYIVVTEYENKRIHHHLVCTAMNVDVIEQAWKHGFVNFKTLDRNGNYKRLAEYLIKETDKTFRLPDSVSKRRWSGSRNLVMPEVRRELTNYRELNESIVPVVGYQIDEDSIRRYDHRILGVECLEYIMVAIDKPRYKRWYKGKRVDYERHYKEEWELQEQIPF